MQVTINGKTQAVKAGITIAELLTQLDLQPIRVAVEVNEDLVLRKTFADTSVNEGDRIEIVTLVGGG
ncbi:MAG: sulfur carrier protein ThiS [Phycisphaerae bacterium]|jgi:thiamine biosynthesis protein ThiS